MKKEVTKVFIPYVLQLFILVYSIISAFERKYMVLLAGIIALFITSLPSILRKKWGVHLPWTLDLMIAFSFFLHMQGLTIEWYTKYYPFYDKFGHFIGSVTIALLGLSLGIAIKKYSKIKMKKIYLVLLIIISTLAIGALWEIGEFLADQLFNQFSQKSLNDTMWDLIYDLAGGIFVGLLTYINFYKIKKIFDTKIIQ